MEVVAKKFECVTEFECGSGREFKKFIFGELCSRDLERLGARYILAASCGAVIYEEDGITEFHCPSGSELKEFVESLSYEEVMYKGYLSLHVIEIGKPGKFGSMKSEFYLKV